MISSSAFRIAVVDQENKEAALTARKGVAKTVRKPLGDRAVNQTPLQKPQTSLQKLQTPRQKPLKLLPLNHCNVNKQNMQMKEDVQKPQVQNTYPDWYADVCSFKEVEDDYQDICAKSDRLDVKDFLNFMLNPKTPPFYDTDRFVPQEIESPLKKFNHYYDSNENIPEIPMFDIEIPEFTF